MIERLLVANRGEVASRVFRTCRELGIATAAVFSDADAGLPYVREADVAVRLPGTAAADTYLRGDLLVAAARSAGADAVHPGYGFLAENAGFARAVLEAGLTWVGPPPEAIAAMGSKVEAKRLMAAAGVPVLPELDPGHLTDADFPVLIKATAGGGGRGMRIVRSASDLALAVESASREAASAFGDPSVFCEPLLEAARHVEVQLLADASGTGWALGERECSIQRRHQKIIEETPSPAVDAALRERLCDAGVRAARAIGYVGAGTVEFLLGADGRFFFLEMNTRLQVEHPVTEAVFAVDLVRLQLEVAEGGCLDGRPPVPIGHAIEARLYAEDPAVGWQPQSGHLHRFDVPAGPALRVDAGVEDGSDVSPHYDPMLAKVIAFAASREGAVRALAGALSRSRIHGFATNRDLLVRVLRHPDFLAGRTDIGFIDRIGLDRLAAPLVDEEGRERSAVAAALAEAAANRARAGVLASVPGGWRNVPSQPRVRAYDGAEIRYRWTRRGLAVEGRPETTVVEATPDHVVLEERGVRVRFDVARASGVVYVDSALGSVALRPLDRFPDPADQVAAGSLLAPMPGVIARVAVAAGDAVERGQPLLWLEAMKMEHLVAAPAAGVVTELHVEVGQQVEVGALLAVIGGASA